MIKVERAHHLLGHRASVYALAQDQNVIYSAGGDGWLARWSPDQLPDGQLLAHIDSQVFALALSPEANLAFAGCMQGGLFWLDLQQGETLAKPLAHEGGCYALQVAQNQLFSAGADGRVHRWTLDTRQKIESLHLCNEGLRSLALSPQGLVAGDRSGQIHLINPDTFTLIRSYAAHENTVFAMLYEPHYQRVWTAGRDAYLRVWAADTWRLLLEQPAHLGTINALAASPCGRFMASASRDKTIKIWDTQHGQLLKVIDTVRHAAHHHSINSLQWLPNGLLASASDDKSLMLWHIA